MDIEFATPDIKALCEQEQLMMRKLGKAGAKKLRSRLADVCAADVVNELVAGRPHPLKGDKTGQFTVDLDGGRRLVFMSANNPVPKMQDRGIDWRSVNRIRIVFIGDYHD